MPGLSRILPVPYFVQPTPITCQSTVLKMMATYLENRVVMASTGAAERDILDIWKDINEDPNRPVKSVRNAHANMKWWLEKYFPNLKFKYMQLTREDLVIQATITFINSGFPILVAVSHARVAGHIVLVIGYENYQPNVSSTDFQLVVHDPYGRFDPSLLSNLYGRSRFTGGASILGGGESGPGQATRLPITAVSRQRVGDSQLGTYYLLGGAS